MTRILFFLLLLPLLLCADSVLRFVLLCLRFFISEKKLPVQTTKSTGCTVLIAARNEADLIGATVASVLPQLNEWRGSSLHIVADHCTDDTAAAAAAAGAQVTSRNDGRLGKGAVIDWWLQRFSEEWKARDVVVILDADSRLVPGSLTALRKAIESGAVAAQAFVKPVTDTTSGRLTGWSEVLMQQIDDTARYHSGWQVPLRGTGMAIRAEVLAALAPQLHTLAEDLELDMLLAARGLRVDFVAEAVLLDPKPPEAAGASRQRARWLRGQFQVMRDYFPEILRALLRGGFSAWFLIPLLLLRPKIMLMMLRLLLLPGTLCGMLLVKEPQLLWLLKAAAVISMSGLLLDFFYYLGAAFVVDNRRAYLRDLLSAPRYGMMWGVGLGLMLVRRGWLRARE